MGKKNMKGPNKNTNKKGKQSFKFKGNKGKKFFHKRTSTFDVNARLVVRNLSFKTTEEILKQHFATFGEVAQVTLLKRPNGDLVGCGFVQFEVLESAKQALASTNNRPFLGRSIQVDWSMPKDKYVANLQESNESKSEFVEFKSEPGLDNDDRTGNIGGENMVDDIKEEDPKPIYNRNDKNTARKRREDLQSKNIINSKILKKARLIVRNISFKATEESLKKHFEPYGDILEVKLLRKPNGDLVGCGFIQLENVQTATKAILKTNAQPFLGRPIHVDWAVAKNKYMSYVTQKKDEEEYLLNEVKSEPESDDETGNKGVKSEISDEMEVKEESDEEDSDEDGSSKDGSDDENEESGEESDDVEDDDDDDEDEEKLKKDSADMKVSANDAEDGKTVFLKNVPFGVDNDQLQEFVQQFGEVHYALICVDKLTEHSKGTAFVRFKNKEDADIFLSAGPERLTLEDQVVEVLPAMFRDRLKGKNTKTKKQPKDSRNLYLIKEGVILANSKAAMGVSASDMAKRLTLEQNKSQILRNFNRFISRYRLTIHNLPPHYTDQDLRKVCLEMANVKPFCLKECRVMKHLKGPVDANGKHMSKGFGFVMFTKHEDALACLRRMNNNPSVFDKNYRPIVSFSIEDKAMINARKKRLEKSLIKNPLSKAYEPPLPEAQEDASENKGKKFSKPLAKAGQKRKQQFEDVEKQVPNKKNKFGKNKQNNEQQKKINNSQGNVNQNSQMNDNIAYSGQAAKPGNVRMRSRFKLNTEALMHKENVKKEKRKKRSARRMEHIKMKEKIKQPKQKQNTNVKTKAKKSSQQKDDKNFSDLVNKYKSKLVSGSGTQRVKSKWYEN